MGKNKKKANKKAKQSDKHNNGSAVNETESTIQMAESNNVDKTNVVEIEAELTDTAVVDEPLIDKKEQDVVTSFSVNNTISSNGEEVKELHDEINTLKKELEEEKMKNKKTDNVKESNNDSPDITTLQKERDHFEEQYNTLLNRLSAMKTIFNNMKEAQLELETTKDQLNEYESQNLKLKNKITSINTENEELKATVVTLNKEFSNMEEENESLNENIKTLEHYKKKIESDIEDASQTNNVELKKMTDRNDKLIIQIEDLTLILDTQKQSISDLTNERDDLKESLDKTQEEQKNQITTIKKLEQELESIDNSSKSNIGAKDQEIKALRVQLDSREETIKELEEKDQILKSKIESLQDNVSENEQLEKKTKDQVLQIGKLKHEAIILNEHLKKALAMLKQSSDSETVDKELISNLLISFVSIPRADPKKFEVLELLSSFLNWDDDKKRQAGLIYSSDNNGNSGQATSKTQSFVALWTEFLERESEKEA
ncbi:similar to Saccharomyces cerevisiae YOR216C RUD3 Golgi matrix protein involved in the structural organization of the cis-Golgi [Maudiozyma barnettii]|uniref:Similar to Saccharomyces cerevisiae YOR216C RUD3 Golgi matrix protein involved in the structural organization of the cis-Golgi n=1 Tax=Maudiozyma barnettii TaxID=61262 RepID=A0A8H2ZGE1_9SACH|nr:Rud3p [Kazachstania barnettii]CAB4253219.1 similar to Saccharomyces cerevisiae YOR216C RUD3 Golgi matrix protein involved in the structural organization of the cis-Golgi [Kazachstania barnettii]CAD1780245.1 similar to Saccharomyces cerevisiae YOR216C RUD3 Golgi matrix protein involved in the structural organization of the cis-Golgi [Kazachstania barnettii]